MSIHKNFTRNIIFTILVSALVLCADAAFAATPPNFTNPVASNDFGTALKKIANAVMKIGIPVLTVAIVYTGFRFVMAQGNEKELEDAKKMLFWVVIATAVIMTAPVIANIACNFSKALDPSATFTCP